jgi:peptidoglycan/xylan/chitin deacetylase (PgdA/CDA1 family)
MDMTRAFGKIGALGAAAAASTLITLGTPSLVSAASPQPAFYTYQAPGGASTVGKKVIALTFDDGPGPYTPQVLSVLEQYHVPATFFEIGENIVKYPQYTKMLAGAGYPVEDHTWTHPDLTAIPASQFGYQIDQTQNEIRSLTGETPTCVRPPYNAWNATVLGQISQRGLTTMSYSIDPRDWSLPGTQAIVDRVVGAATPGAVVDMHDGGGTRSQTVDALPQIIGDLQSKGYTFVSICGQTPETSAVYGFGEAPSPGQPVTSDAPLVGAATGPQSGGYWLAGADGGVFSFGDAAYYGSLPALGITPAQPIVAMASTPDGGGYWMLGADGGVFGFGDAGYYGSLPASGITPAQPVVAMASTPEGGGYWLVGADGGVFSFGDAAYYGSLPALGVTPAQPIVAMASTPDGGGYWMVGADGGVFGFGDAANYGSLPGLGITPAQPMVAMASTPDGGGYWVLGADGGVFSFGDAAYFGSGVGETGVERYFAICTTDAGQGYLLAGDEAA